MPFDVVAWAEAAPGTGTVGITAALNDQIYQSSLDTIICKARAPYILGVLYAAVSTPGHAQIRAPSLKNYYQFQKSGTITDLHPAGAFTDYMGRPLPVPAKEKLTAYSENATDEQTLIGLLLGSGRITQAMKDSVSPTHVIRGSWDLTLTALTWSAAAPVWDQNLPAGRYAVIGMRVGSYVAAFELGMARLILPESVYRPGVPIVGLVGDKVELDAQAPHPWELWPKMDTIEIEHDNMPQVEIMSPKAATDHTIELTLEKIG